MGQKRTLLPLLLILTSCASSQVNIFTSPPQAKIYAKPLGEGKRVLVGETPLSTSAKGLEATSASSGPLLIEFEKEGYETKSLVLSDLNMTSLLLNVELHPANGVADQTTMNWLVENSFEVQRLVKAHRLSEAEKLLIEMKRVAPQVAVTHELLGGVYYVRRNYEQSYDSYNEALKFNPKSTEALKMSALLREIVKTRAPSSLSVEEQSR